MYVLNVVKHIPCLCVVVCACVWVGVYNERERERESLDYCFNENSDQIRNLPQEYSSLSFSLQYLAEEDKYLFHILYIMMVKSNWVLLMHRLAQLQT